MVLLGWPVPWDTLDAFAQDPFPSDAEPAFAK
jgi:hypothetical protein